MSCDRRRRAMWCDPDLTGDLLLLALALDELLTADDSGVDAARWVQNVERIARGPWRAGQLPGQWVKRVIEVDAPRYEPAGNMFALTCTAPTGDQVCGRPATGRTIDRDPHTGEGAWVCSCGDHPQYSDALQARHQQWEANGRPFPPTNRGGVLRRYFAIDADLYRWAAPHLGQQPPVRIAVPPLPSPLTAAEPV